MKNYYFYILISSTFIFSAQEGAASCESPVKCFYDSDKNNGKHDFAGWSQESYHWSWYFGMGFYPDKLHSSWDYEPSRKACGEQVPECHPDKCIALAPRAASSCPGY